MKATATQIKKMFETGVLNGEHVAIKCNPDKIISHPKAGTIEFRRGFFYRFGQSSGDFALAIEKDLHTAKIDAILVEDFENWQPWPRDSYFSATFKINFS